MRIAYKDSYNRMTVVREFDSLIPVRITAAINTMHPDEVEQVCMEAVFKSNDNERNLYVTFQIPCKYYSKSRAFSISYGQLWKYVLQYGYFDFTQEKIKIDGTTFLLDCEVNYS